MSNDDNRKTISKVLNIENNAAWQIVSSDPEHNLVMVHHKPEANLDEFGQIRGIAIDTEAEAVVCRSFGYTPVIESDRITIQEDGNVHLTDEMEVNHTVNPARAIFKIGFEGTIINVFKHDGVVYRSTRKRLDASRSRWGSSKTFMDMYWSLGGPSDDVLFNPTSEFSPYCHTFIIVHPDVLVVSKDNIGDGYLVYLGPKQMWSTDLDTCPYKQTQEDGSLFDGVTQEDFDADTRPRAGWIDDTLHLPQTVSDMTDDNPNHAIFSPPNLSFDETNKHLLFGFYNSFEGYEKLDNRTLPGEFVIIHNLDENGAITGMLRVESPSYRWRSGMRDNNPNILHRFFQLVNGSYLRGNQLDRYNKLYPTFTPYDDDSIKKQVNEDGAYVVWPQDSEYNDPENLMDKESRMYNIWIAFLNSVPLHQQKEVVTFLDYLYQKRGELIGWLRSVESRGQLDTTVFSSRTINLIESARRFSQQKVKSGQDKGRDGRKLSLKDLTRDNIRNLVMKEEGSSLYRLIRKMDIYKKK